MLHIEDSTFSGVYTFLRACRDNDVDYRLTPKAEATPFARCFAIYILHLLRDAQLSELSRQFGDAIVADVRAKREALNDAVALKSKPYRQLLTFSLSALAVLPGRSPAELNDLVLEQLPEDLDRELHLHGCLRGVAGSGNQAMFLAIFLLHARDFADRDTSRDIELWVSRHLASMNSNGFWGGRAEMTHLQFQNGYHQHEILEYLQVDSPHSARSIDAVLSLADPGGHFAPYPGGGGCYDYDAVFMLTPHGGGGGIRASEQLLHTAKAIMGEQNSDGGFAETLQVRPRSISNVWRSANRVFGALGNVPLFVERLRYAVALQRPKHNHVHTHWSEYSREWSESDLWDTWFRLLALARVDVSLDPRRATDWGFIDYPGIGFHPSLRAQP